MKTAVVLHIFQISPRTPSTYLELFVPSFDPENERICIQSFYNNEKEDNYVPAWPKNCHFHMNGINLKIRNEEFFIDDISKHIIINKPNEYQICHDVYDTKAFLFVIQKISLTPFKDVYNSVSSRSYQEGLQFVVNSFKKKRTK